MIKHDIFPIQSAKTGKKKRPKGHNLRKKPFKREDCCKASAASMIHRGSLWQACLGSFKMTS